MDPKESLSRQVISDFLNTLELNQKLPLPVLQALYALRTDEKLADINALKTALDLRNGGGEG